LGKNKTHIRETFEIESHLFGLQLEIVTSMDIYLVAA
jgi:hypothetical protein